MLQMTIVDSNETTLGVYKVKSLETAKAIVAGTEKAKCAAVATYFPRAPHDVKIVGVYIDGEWF